MLCYDTLSDEQDNQRRLLNDSHRVLNYLLVVARYQQEAKLWLGELTVLPHSTFGGHVTSSVT